MQFRYDRSSKWLMEHHGDAILRLAGVEALCIGVRCRPSWSRGEAMLLETPLMQRLIADVERKTARQDVLRVLRARFSTISPELAAAIQSVSDASQLDHLLSEAAICPDLDAFQRALPAPAS